MRQEREHLIKDQTSEDQDGMGEANGQGGESRSTLCYLTGEHQQHAKKAADVNNICHMLRADVRKRANCYQSKRPGRLSRDSEGKIGAGGTNAESR